MKKLITQIVCKIYPHKHGKPIIKFVEYGLYAERIADSKIQNLILRFLQFFGHQDCVSGTCNLHKSERRDGIEKGLSFAGYVQHSEFWQKGFVRVKKIGNIWKVWHDLGTGEYTGIDESDLFATLKYFERI